MNKKQYGLNKQSNDVHDMNTCQMENKQLSLQLIFELWLFVLLLFLFAAPCIFDLCAICVNLCDAQKYLSDRDQAHIYPTCFTNKLCYLWVLKYG